MSIHRDDPCGPGRFVPPVRSIQRRTAIPGPQSRAILARRAAMLGLDVELSASPSGAVPIVVAHAHGARVIDVDNNVFLDFSGGGFGVEVGYTHEEVVGAAQGQIEGLDALPRYPAISEAQVRLGERLNALTAASTDPMITLLFDHALTARRFLRTVRRAWRVYQPFQPLSALPPTGAAPLSDETHIGLGRTGRFLAADHLAEMGVARPDALLYGGREWPIVALTLRRDFLTPAQRRRAGQLPSVSPLACVRVLEALRLMAEQRLVERATQIVAIVRDQLSGWVNRYPAVVGVEAVGALLAVRFRSPRVAKQMIVAGAQAGVLLQRLPYAKDVIPLCYPLMIPEEQLYEGLSAMEDAIETLNETSDSENS